MYIHVYTYHHSIVSGIFSDLGVLLEVVPIPVVHPLPQQLNGRLGTIHLSSRHVQVIHKHNLRERERERAREREREREGERERERKSEREGERERNSRNDNSLESINKQSAYTPLLSTQNSVNSLSWSPWAAQTLPCASCPVLRG